MRYYVAILLSCLLIASCDKGESPTPLDFGYDYYPSEIGSWIIYDVDSIVYNDFTVPPTIDTFQFQLRELYESYFLDAAGDTNIRIEQSVRANENAAWQISHIGSLKHSPQNTQKVVNDLRYIRMIHPPTQGETWEGHLYLDVLDEPTLSYLDRNQNDWTHSIVSSGSSFDVANNTFPDCVEVLQIDDENLFEKKYSKEVYGRGIGLLYKELMILATQAPPSGVPFLERAESGFVIVYRINDYQM